MQLQCICLLGAPISVSYKGTHPGLLRAEVMSRSPNVPTAVWVGTGRINWIIVIILYHDGFGIAEY
jgi:hypothetical protein